MSTSEKIFTNVTILQSYKLWLNDIQLIDDDVISLEIKWGFNDFKVSGSLVLKDPFEISELDIFNGNTTLKIVSSDFYGESFSKTFVITNIAVEEVNERFKMYSFSFVDRIYFNLLNTYVSKSFTDTLPNAINSYFTYTDISTVITDESLIKDFDTGSVSSFVVPQDRNAFEFFNEQLKREGFRWWQDKYGIHIKKVDINSFDEVQDEDGNPIKYTNATTNALYGFKIHDFTLSYNNIILSNTLKPIEKNFKYDISTKNVDTSTTNLNDIYSTLKLNTSVLNTDFSLQHTVGEKYTYQEFLSTDNQKVDIEDIYNNNNLLEIVVPGNYKHNKPGEIINVQFKGSSIVSKIALEGNTFHSGKYFVNAVSDRYFGNKMIQKLSLSRIDFQKSRGEE